MRLPALIDSKLSVDNGTAVLSFAREDVHNSFAGTSLASDVVRVINWAEQHEGIGLLVLTGQGDSFSEDGPARTGERAQGAIVKLGSVSPEKNRSDVQRMMQALWETDVPIIAAVNGPATGAGFNLCCLCDFRIGSGRALLGTPVSEQVESTGALGVLALQRIIGHQRAMEMVFSGRLVLPDEALATGLLLDVVEAEGHLLPTVRQFAQKLASRSSRVLRGSKRLTQLAGRWHGQGLEGLAGAEPFPGGALSL